MKRAIVFAFVTALMLVACGYNFAEQDIAIENWSHTDEFHLGVFEVEFLAGGDTGRVDFRVKDKSVFLQSILNHPALVRQEYNTKQNKVYVFLESGNYYLLLEVESNNKQGEYTLLPAASRYITMDGTMYRFPLYDCSIRYDGMVFFHEDRNTAKTKNDWQYFINFFDALPSDCVIIDESKKSVLLSAYAKKIINGERIIDSAQKIKIVFRSDADGNYLIASLETN